MNKEVINVGPATDGAVILELLLAGGGILPEQWPNAAHWSPEKELAAAVLMDALVEVRDFQSHPLHKRQVAEDLEWIFSNDAAWPFSFIRLCEVFGLNPASVREVVFRWLIGPSGLSERSRRPAA